MNCGFRDDFSSHLDIYIGLPSTGVRSSFNASITQSYNKIYESDCCLMPTQQFSAISWREQVNFQRDDDEVSFAGFDTNFPSILVQRANSLRI